MIFSSDRMRKKTSFRLINGMRNKEGAWVKILFNVWRIHYTEFRIIHFNTLSFIRKSIAH